jgi:hypothetical protein
LRELADLAAPDFVALREAALALAEALSFFAVLGAALLARSALALTLRVVPPVLVDAGEVASVGEPDPDVAGVVDADGVGVGAAADGAGVGLGEVPVVGSGVDTVLGGGGVGGLVLPVVVLVGDGDGDELDWDPTSSHCWLAVTTDAVCADNAAEALDVPS